MIAYTPIDMTVTLPDETVLKDYFFKNNITNLAETTGYTSSLCSLISRSPIDNWRDANQVFADYTGNDLYYAPGVRETLPELIDFIHRLPYTELIGAVLNLHTAYLAPHRDECMNLDIDGPERYNLLLTNHYEQDSFFICEEQNSEKKYPKILKDYPVYAFNNNKIYHGADTVLDQRIILICAGILDKEKHEELINRSVEKFREYVIEV